MSDPLGVGEVRAPKASKVLSDLLRARILDGDLADGTPISSERQLAVDTRMSRTAVREAVRVLEAEGLVSVRPGRGGGMFARRPRPETITRSLEHYIRSHSVRFGSLVEIRESIEPDCAAFAAERCTEEDVDELVAINERVRAASRLDDPSDFLTENVAWHVAISVASRNELLAAFMQAISDAIRAATDIEDFNSATVKADAVGAHDAILAAIRARDGELARRRMHSHVQAYRKQVLSGPVPDVLALERHG